MPVASQARGSVDEDVARWTPHLTAGLLTGVRGIAGSAADVLRRLADWAAAEQGRRTPANTAAAALAAGSR